MSYTDRPREERDYGDAIYDEELSIRREEPAGFWIRVAATLLDGVFLLPVSLLSVYALIGMKSLELTLLFSVPGLLYKPLMEAYYGATWGKMVCGIKVVDVKGERLSVLAAYVRYLPWLLPAALGIMTNVWLFDHPRFQKMTFIEHGMLLQSNPYYWATQLTNLFILIDVLTVLFNDHKRAIHDMMAGSFCVVKSFGLPRRRPRRRPRPDMLDERIQRYDF